VHLLNINLYCHPRFKEKHARWTSTRLIGGTLSTRYNSGSHAFVSVTAYFIWRRIFVPHTKFDCDLCPPDPHQVPSESPNDWEMHPSWILGIESLNAYSHWVSSVVLPIAFQWIDEHRAEVYATVPDNLKDDVGTVLAAAFKLIKNLPAYQRGLTKNAMYQTAKANGDTAAINPAWASITQTVRTDTQAAFTQQTSLSVD